MVRRFLAVFYPAAEYLRDDAHHARRRRAVQERRQGAQAARLARSARQGSAGGRRSEPRRRSPPDERVEVARDRRRIANQTKPPARFTEATLLTAMEGAGKLVEDEELRDAMEAKGLGTPATRAVDHREADRTKSTCTATAASCSRRRRRSRCSRCSAVSAIPELTSPELTGEWEYKLKRDGARQALARRVHGRHRGDDARSSSSAAKAHESDTVPGDYATLRDAVPEVRRRREGELQEVPVPEVRLRAVAHHCRAAQFEPAEIEELITKRLDRPAQGFRSRLGKPFSADHQADAPSSSVEFDFGQQQGDDDGEAAGLSAPGERSGRAPSAARASSSTAWPTSARRPSGPAARAISAPARSSCSGRSSARRCRSS